ncbi:MAG: chemotaxis protein CheA [Desulfuromonadales bacterium]|nr:chemotaxis protein CheA [Desulfuromonadales bacterium]
MSQQSVSHKAVKEFLAETEEIVEQLGSQLADLADMADRGELNPDLLNSIFRGAHSLKGLAGMFGYTDITELSHNMENLLDILRLGKIKLNPNLMEVLFGSHELLTSLVRSVEAGPSAARTSEISACISRINACLSDHPETPTDVSPILQLGLDGRVLGALTEYEEHRLLYNLNRGNTIFSVHTSFELTTFDQDLGQVSDILKTCGEVISTLPSMGNNQETHIDFEILFGSGRSLDDVKNLFENNAIYVIQLEARGNPETGIHPPPLQPVHSTDVSLHVTAQQQPSAMSVETSSLAADDATVSAKSMSRTVRVDIGKLDDLMNIVGELVLAHSAISGVAVRMRNEGFSRMAIDLNKAAKGLERKLTDLQKGVMEIRMIPVGQLYEKMSRIIRKMSREQGKKVELRFFGADTELDKLIVEDISDPMMHIIRNAIDHGIETPEKRATLGKDEKGTIRIASYQKGNHVVIEVEDDGSGIDLDKVKAKALQAGLITDVTAISDREAIDFIFMPGFSTNDKVSEASGRGVGMDVVRNNIAAVSGIVDVETSKGVGSRFIITLPITLAIIKALIITCAGRTYALPITSILESLLLTDADIKTVERKEVIQLREQTLPLLRLESFFGIHRSTERLAEFYVVVVGVAEKRLGIVVDDLLGQQDIVIKSLGESFRRFRGISGAADLGDQRTILVLDVGSMINETMRAGN